MEKRLRTRWGWLITITAALTTHLSFAQQQLTPVQWENAKAQGRLDPKAPATFLVTDSLPVVARIAPNVPVQPATSSCSCWQPRDGTFSVVPFTNGSAPAYRNDDGFTSVIALPFTFCLYGQSWNTVYINNNGNVSFGAPYATFTASGFPNAAFEMVAPFWADVDTRNPLSGLVYYKITPTYMIVQWDSVGYYNSHANLTNTFQLIITDGSDPLVPNGNVSFCYRDMQWTTGDASSGSGGFGGSDAIVGANRGDGVNYIQFGAFNQPGGNYNGPASPNSGIDWLDNQSFTFDACTNSNNIPPTPAGLTSCDTLRICQNDTLPLDIQFFSPEVAQVTTISVSAPGVNGYTIVSNTPGNTAQLVSYIVGQSNNLGYNTITITATDNGTPNASTVITVVVLVVASPTSSAVTTSSTCAANNGSATVTASGGSGLYTYVWTPSGGTAATANNLGPGTYTCTITDAVTGCSTEQVATVTSTGGVTATQSFTNVVCNGGNDGTATVNPSGGTLPYSYAWSPSGGTNPTATGLSPGTYTCTTTDANGCTDTQSFTITEPAAFSVTTLQTDVLCNGGTNGSAGVTVSGGSPGYTYSWSPSGGTNATATGLSNNFYTCTITDANGCITTQTFAITEPPPLTCTINAVSSACNGGTATAVPFGGTGPYSYQWSNFSSFVTQNNLSAGTYSVTVTDANGCTTMQSVTITSPPQLAASTSWSNINCYGDSIGTANVVATGGTPGYTYSWAPYGGTAASATGLIAGTYTCTITDAGGCTTTRIFTLTQPSQITSTTTQTNILCNGNATGSTTLTASGGMSGYTYSWAPAGGTNNSANNLPAGTYTCTITDSYGCSVTQTVTITEPPLLTASVSVVNVSCLGQGSATASPSGGTAPYTYSWSSSGTNATENNLGVGTYTVTITDANSCTTQQIATIGNDPAVTATSSSMNANCFGGASGSGTVVPSGGTAPYTYSWSPSGGSNATATGLTAGTYVCTITDANGCSTTQTIIVTQPPQLTATATSTSISCNGGSDGTTFANATGGVPGYAFSWAPSGGSNMGATGLSAGNYTVTVTDANGCTTTQSVTVTEPSAVFLTTIDDAVCLGDTAQLFAVVNGGTSPYTYLWANGATTASVELVVGSNVNVPVTITDANGCIMTGSADIVVNPLPTASAAANLVNGIFILYPGTPLCFTGSGNGASTWSWSFSNGGTSTDQSPCLTVTAADTGIFCAALTTQNSYGCTAYSQVCLEIMEAGYFVPNVFTPNNDGTNDVFMIQNSGMKLFHCIIYDRWGAVVYEWDSPTGYWDGQTLHGGEATDGVYYWTLTMQDFGGKDYASHGFVHLLRGN